MSAILLMSGPVCSRTTMNSNGPKILRHITSEQFMSAARKLERANLGAVVEVKINMARSSQMVFVKKSPTEVGPGLRDNADLCCVEEYAVRFNMRPPASLSLKLREKLVTMGLLHAEHFLDV